MPLVLYNSLTRRKEPFEPIDAGLVRMYVCGPTVYDLAHIGNGRAVIAFDLLYRVLRHAYGAGHVRYVRNITDVEDKIIAAARDSGEPIDALTARTTAEFHADMAALGALPPDIEPRATAYIPQMIALIERLISAGHAYAAEGHALFAVASWPSYGKLARRSRNEMLTVDGVKMSKSLGNILTVRGILEKAPSEAIRLALLSTHYRDPLDWTEQKWRQARASLDRFYRALSLPGDRSEVAMPGDVR